MSDRQLKLRTTETAGSKIVKTTTISNVNPEATGADMLTYAKKLNAFTTNVYGETNLVETTNLDTETIKTEYTIELPNTITEDGANYAASITINGASGTRGYGFFEANDNKVYKVSYTNEPGKYRVTTSGAYFTQGTITLIVSGTNEYYTTVARKTVTKE